jgi:hypothetical protein
MKKLLFVFVLGAFAACGSGETAAPAVDSAAIKATADSLAKVAADSAAKATMVDSAAMKAAADSLAKAAKH